MKNNLLLAVTLAGLWAMSPAEASGGYSPDIEIRSVSDFYVPLASVGHWVEIKPYGWCWYPATVDRSWRPYSSGNWVWCDQGWYWDSDEPWAWAAYHYGGWVWDANYFWVWVPDVVWAPSRVSWREGGGYVGWAPQPPATPVVVVVPQYFVFVEERHFCQPIRPTVLVANQTVINRTVRSTTFGGGFARSNPDRMTKLQLDLPTLQPPRSESRGSGWAQRPGPVIVRPPRATANATVMTGNDRSQDARPSAVPILSEPGRVQRQLPRDGNLGALAAQGR